METTSNLPECNQVELFAPDVLPAGWDILPEQQHRFTGERVARNRERYLAIAHALAEGLGVRQIARAFGCSAHTVARVRETANEVVAAEKEHVSRKLGTLIRMSLERFEEGLVNREIHPSQLPVAIGIFTDKKLLLEGGVTSRVEHTNREISVEVVERALRSLKATSITVESEPVSTDLVDQKAQEPAQEPGSDSVTSSTP